MPPPWGHVTALVADDEPVVRELLGESLRTIGVGAVEFAEDGDEALRRIAEKAYELLLVDLAMPKARGEAVVEDALRRHPEAVVIVVTGHATLETAVALMKQGVADLIRKPFGYHTLKSKVESALRRAADRRASAAERIVGPYEILSEVSRGGVGVVYRARQRETGEIVALKVLLSGQKATEEQVERFYREAKAVQELRHPNIVAVHEVGCAGGRHYIAMEFIEGRPLDVLIYNEELTLKRALRIAAGTARGIHYAHEREVLHRDVKPSNVIVDGDWRPHVIDFGLARFVREAQRLTRSRRVYGTFGYIAPERYAAGGTEGDVRGDVFSLGVLSYEMLTNRLPYRMKAEAGFSPDFGTPPEPPSRANREIPAPLDEAVLRALSVEPGARFPSARAFADAFDKLLSHAKVDFRLKYEEE